MNKFLVNHFEKLIFAIVVIICLILVIGNVQKYLDNKQRVTEHGKLKEIIEGDLNGTSPPPGIEAVGDYTAALSQKIAGNLVLNIPEYRAGTVYTPSLQLPPPIAQREVLILVPPKVNGEAEEEKKNVIVEPGRHLVALAFENDDSVKGEIVNNFPKEHPDNPDYEGHTGAVFGAVLQRRLVHDGKADVSAANKWLTLTGSPDRPEWQLLENPLETTYILTGDRDFMARQDFDAGGGEGPDGEMGGEGMWDPDRGFDPRMMPRGGGRREEGKEVSMRFELEDLHQRGFQTFAYRMAIIAAVQKGVRVFLQPRTAEDIAADELARRDRNPAGYAPGIDYFPNPQISPDALKKFGVSLSGGSRNFRMGAPAPTQAAPFYLVLSAWSSEYKATVDTDSKIILSGMFGDQVSIFVLKHVRYEYEVKQAGPGGGEEMDMPMRGRAEGPKRMAKATATVLRSFTHSKGQKIGHDPKGLRQVGGRDFIDGKARLVDFTTPFILEEIGKGDRNFQVERPVMSVDENGQPVRTMELQDRVERDVPYIRVKNVFTNEITQHWREGGEVITEIRRLAAEAMLKQKEINEKKAKAIRRTPARPVRPDDPSPERPSETGPRSPMGDPTGGAPLGGEIR